MAYTDETKIEALLLESITTSSTPTSTQVNTFIEWADDLINSKTGTVFELNLASSEVHSYDGNGFVRVDKGPIVSVSSISVDQNGFNSATADWQTLSEGRLAANDFYIDEYDPRRINFKTSTTGNSPVRGIQNLKITYNYGRTTVPFIVEELSTALVVNKVLQAKIMSNTFSSQDSISIGPIRIDKSNVTSGNMRQVNDYIKTLWEQVGSFQVKGRNII